MSTELEKRIQILEDIESIRKLKAKYWYCVDGKDWDGLAECLTDDYIFDSPHLGNMAGKNFVVKVLKRVMKNITTAHQGHTPEIDIQSDTTATGKWALNDYVETPEKGFFTGRGLYRDEYVKEDGCWKIRKSVLTYLFRESSAQNPS